MIFCKHLQQLTLRSVAPNLCPIGGFQFSWFRFFSVLFLKSFLGFEPGNAQQSVQTCGHGKTIYSF